MSETITDDVKVFQTDEENRPVLRDWTPHGAYMSLWDATDRAGLDLDEYGDGTVIGRATVDANTGDVLEFEVSA